MNKKEKSLSDLIGDTLYENCCKGKQCKNCKYDSTNFYCHIIKIIKIVSDYEKRCNI